MDYWQVVSLNGSDLVEGIGSGHRCAIIVAVCCYLGCFVAGECVVGGCMCVLLFIVGERGLFVQ